MTDQTPPNAADSRLEPLALVQPGPLGFAVNTAHGGDGTRFVMLRFEHAAGSFVAAMPVDFARQVGQTLLDAADDGPAQGLVIPTVKVPGL